MAQLLMYPFENFRTRQQVEGQNYKEIMEQDDSDDVDGKSTSADATEHSYGKEHENKVSPLTWSDEIKAFRKLLKTEGFLSLYKGLKMALSGTVVAQGSFFFFFRAFKNLLTRVLRNGKSLNKRHISVATLFAGVAASVICNPFWFIVTR